MMNQNPFDQGRLPMSGSHLFSSRRVCTRASSPPTPSILSALWLCKSIEYPGKICHSLNIAGRPFFRAFLNDLALAKISRQLLLLLLRDSSPQSFLLQLSLLWEIQKWLLPWLPIMYSSHSCLSQLSCNGEYDISKEEGEMQAFSFLLLLVINLFLLQTCKVSRKTCCTVIQTTIRSSPARGGNTVQYFQVLHLL